MSNRFVLILIVLVVGFAGIFWFTKHKDSASSNGAQPSNHLKGDNTKNVTLVEYGDFECPACYYYEPIVEQVYAKYQHDIQFQYRNFPLVQIHQHAMSGHRAAEAAAKQGKFWEMHDLLYQHAHTYDQNGKVQDTEWTTTDNNTAYFVQYAGQLGLNIDKFKQDMQSEDVNNVINADMAEGQKLGVTGTPTFFLNGKKIDNPTDLAGFSKLIDTEIASKIK